MCSLICDWIWLMVSWTPRSKHQWNYHPYDIFSRKSISKYRTFCWRLNAIKTIASCLIHIIYILVIIHILKCIPSVYINVCRYMLYHMYVCISMWGILSQLIHVEAEWRIYASVNLSITGSDNGPFTRYAKLRVAHAPGMPGTFSPPLRFSNPDMHHGTCVTHVSWCMPGSLTSCFRWSRWQGKRFRHSRRMRNPQFCVSGKRPMA